MRALLPVLLLATFTQADVAVPSKGPILRGEVKIDRERRRLVFGDEDRPLSGFLLVERDDGTHVWARTLRDRLTGYRRLVYETRRPELLALSKEALRARDHVTARRLYAWAKKEGLSGRDERVLRKRIEKAEAKPKKVRDKIRAAVLRTEKQLRQRLPELLMARAKLAEGKTRLVILRELLRVVPDHGGALAMIEKLVPANSPFREPRAWLAWHLDLETKGFRLAAPDLMALRRAQHHWRPDLYGVEADGMLVITPIRRLEIVAACVRRARMTRDSLAEMFRTDKPKLRTKAPLTVHLFADGRNFAERAGYSGGVSDFPPYFRWEYGHWDLKEDLTRLLCPDTVKKPGNRKLAYTLVHELVRHWVWSRCPRVSDTELLNAGPVAGYGVAAGFPGFVAEASYDLAGGRPDFAGKKGWSLGLVRAEANKNALIPWRKFFLMTWEDVHVLNRRDPALADGKRKKNTLLQAHLLMAQGAAVCHYLYNANSGARRKALLDFLTNHYLGNQSKLNPRLAFGMHPDDLGKAVVAWVAD